MVSITRILRAIEIPLMLVLYGIVWIAVQPFLIMSLRILDTGTPVLRQVISVVAYLLINAVWLFLWYKLVKYVRDRSLLKQK